MIKMQGNIHIENNRPTNLSYIFRATVQSSDTLNAN